MAKKVVVDKEDYIEVDGRYHIITEVVKKYFTKDNRYPLYMGDKTIIELCKTGFKMYVKAEKKHKKEYPTNSQSGITVRIEPDSWMRSNMLRVMKKIIEKGHVFFNEDYNSLFNFIVDNYDEIEYFSIETGYYSLTPQDKAYDARSNSSAIKKTFTGSDSYAGYGDRPSYNKSHVNLTVTNLFKFFRSDELQDWHINEIKERNKGANVVVKKTDGVILLKNDYYIITDTSIDVFDPSYEPHIQCFNKYVIDIFLINERKKVNEQQR